MVNTVTAASLIALIVAAASFGYASFAVSGEAGQLRTQIKQIDQNLATVQKDIGELKSSLQRSLEETRKIAAEREALIQQITPFDPALVAAAIKEGGLTIYSVRDQEDIVVLSQEFQKKFPGIKVSFFNARELELLARITAEAKQSQSTWDIYDAGARVLGAAANIGATQRYVSKQYTPENFPIVDPDRFFYGATIPVMIYNPKLVKKSDLDAVKTWEDVPKLAAKYQGKVLMDHPTRLGSHTQILGELKSYWKDDSRWSKYLGELKALGARMFKSTGEIGRLIISEEGSIGIVGLLHDVLQARVRGSPLEFMPVSPLVVQPFGVVISKNAPHPNSAKLLVEFMLSPDGQEVFSRAFRSPMRTGFVSKSSGSVLFPNVPSNQIIGTLNQELLADPQDFAKRYLEPVFGPA
ncbi:MAG: extracellular solute-binding protein [Thaumarchaeota archaeon]|nr:extracellular solute-binding protein [Nitrososphaerota archaeon]